MEKFGGLVSVEKGISEEFRLGHGSARRQK
jgi:hypothetical protein